MYYNNYDVNNLEYEKWLPILGYKDLYEVSCLGRVKRIAGFGRRKDRIARQYITDVGRCAVMLSKHSKIKRVTVHRLVGLAFIENPDNKPNVLHKDDNPLNNAVSNLWWGTQKENIIDCHNKGRACCMLPKYKKGEHPWLGQKHTEEAKNKIRKSQTKIPTEIIVLMLNDIKNKAGNKSEIARKYGVSISYLTNLSNGRGTRSNKL